MTTSGSKRSIDRSRTDQRFVAEAVTETGVVLTGYSGWEPYHWDRESLRKDAVQKVRSQAKQADLLKVKVGPIRVHREMRYTETVATTYIEAKFDSELT